MAYEDITSSSMRLTLVLLLVGFACFFSGLFDQPTPVSKETLEGLTFAYLQYQGPFTHIPTILNTVTSRLGSYGSSIEAAMFFDNPEDPKIGWNNVRWAAGALIHPHEKQKALNSDLLVITLPSISVIKTRIAHRSPFSVMFSPHKAYPLLASYVEENNLGLVGPAIEIYGDDYLDYMFCAGEGCGLLKWKEEGEVHHPVVDPLMEKVEPVQGVVMEKVVEVKEKIGEKIGEMTEKGSEKMEEMKEKAEEKIGEMKEKGGEKMEEMKEKAKDKFGEIKEKGGKKVEEMKEMVKEEIEEMKEKTKEKIEEMKEKGEEMKEKTKEKIGEMTEKGGEKMEEMKEKTEEKIGEMKEKSGEKMEEMKEKGGAKAEEVKEKIVEMKDKSGEAVRDGLEGLKEGGEKTVEGVKKKMEEGEEKAEEMKEKTKEKIGEMKEKGQEKVEEMKEEGKHLMEEIRKKAKFVPDKITETAQRIVVDLRDLDARYRKMIHDFIQEKGWKTVDGSDHTYEIPKSEMTAASPTNPTSSPDR